MSDKISIMIPVHNGEKYICNLVKHLQRQTWKNKEIILVENNSSDCSRKICEKMQENYNNVKVFFCEEKGTSYARKMGTINSTGKYIVYMDQDDRYINNKAIEEMYRAIEEDGSQICQFSYYKNYLGIYKRRLQLNSEQGIYTRDRLFENDIKGILGIKDSNFSVNVWNKIYDGELLRNAVRKINNSLLFAEDIYLNILAFFNDDLKCVSFRNNAYYCWKFGVGFSSTIDSGKALFSDYKIVKPLAFEMLKKYKCPEEILFACMSETVWFFRVLMNEMIISGVSKQEVINCIVQIDEAIHVKLAKEYFNKQTIKTLENEFAFLVSEYTSEEYYAWCLEHKEKHNFKVKIANCVKLLMKYLSR